MEKRKEAKSEQHFELGIIHVSLHLILQFHVVGTTVYHDLIAEGINSKRQSYIWTQAI